MLEYELSLVFIKVYNTVEHYGMSSQANEQYFMKNLIFLKSYTHESKIVNLTLISHIYMVES